jgi:hypothetical protein
MDETENLREAVDRDLQTTRRLTKIGRDLGGPAWAEIDEVRVTVPDNLVPVFDYLISVVGMHEAIIKRFATEIDRLRARQ